MMRRLILLFSFTLFCPMLKSQSARVARHSIKTTFDNHVSILWTMNAGSTCPSLSIERSTDQTNYQKIYTYPSVCGSSDIEISYSWTDTNPVLYSKSYYRLNLDDIEFTVPVEIDLQAILSNSTILFYPNPSNGSFTLELRNPFNQNFNIAIYTSNGKRVYWEEDLSGRRLTLSLSDLKKGVYTLEISFQNGQVEANRFVVSY